LILVGIVALLSGISIIICIKLLYTHSFEKYEYLQRSIFYFYATIFLAVLFWQFSSIYFAVKHSRALQNLDKSKFEAEKFWLWSFFALLPIMTINWFTEFALFASSSFFYYDKPSALSDVIKLLTALNIFVIFVMRENVKLLIFKNYRTFQRSLSA
jgi:hypothetical protein